MRFELGHKGDYALRAMLHLACHEAEGLQKARAIAGSMDIPEKYLPQILGDLIRHGLVISMAGPHGGYAVARPATTISLLEVIEAAEGPVGSTVCPLRGRPCDSMDPCAVHHAWRTSQDMLVTRLASVALDSLLADGSCDTDCLQRRSSSGEPVTV